MPARPVPLARGHRRRGSPDPGMPGVAQPPARRRRRLAAAAATCPEEIAAAEVVASSLSAAVDLVLRGAVTPLAPSLAVGGQPRAVPC